MRPSWRWRTATQLVRTTTTLRAAARSRASTSRAPASSGVRHADRTRPDHHGPLVATARLDTNLASQPSLAAEVTTEAQRAHRAAHRLRRRKRRGHGPTSWSPPSARQRSWAAPVTTAAVTKDANRKQKIAHSQAQPASRKRRSERAHPARIAQAPGHAPRISFHRVSWPAVPRACSAAAVLSLFANPRAAYAALVVRTWKALKAELRHQPAAGRGQDSRSFASTSRAAPTWPARTCSIGRAGAASWTSSSAPPAYGRSRACRVI